MDLPSVKKLVAKLEHILNGPNAKERERAIAKLGELGREGNKEAIAVLQNALFDEWNIGHQKDGKSVRVLIVRALAATNSFEAAKTLLEAVKDRYGGDGMEVAVASAKALGSMKCPHEITDALFQMVRAKEYGYFVHPPEIRAEAIKTIGTILAQNPGEYPRIVRLLGRIALSKTEDAEVKLAAIDALGKSGSREAIKPLYALLSTESILSKRQDEANPYNREIAYSTAAKGLQNISRVQEHEKAAEVALYRAARKNESAKQAIIAAREPPQRARQKQEAEPQRERQPSQIASVVPARKEEPEQPRRRKMKA